MKRKYPQEMLLMNDCPKCGQEVNRQFVEDIIDEIVFVAVSNREIEILKEIHNLARIIMEGESEEMSDSYFAKMATIKDIERIINI